MLAQQARLPFRQIIRLDGRLDAHRVATLDRHLRSDACSGPHDTVEIDLSAVSFIDAAAIDHLTEWAADASRRGGTLRITGASQPVRIILAITGADARLGVSGLDGAARTWQDRP